jgi:hypothetical protein
MAEIVVKIPEELEMGEELRSRLREDIESVVRLRLARELILKRLDEMLKDSKLTDEECLELGEKVKEGVFKRWKEKGWL